MPKAVLLSKAQADLKSLVSPDSTRPHLQHIHVTKEYAEATNGHSLLRVHHCELDPDEFPSQSKKLGTFDFESALVNPKTLETVFRNIKRSSVPILEYAHTAVDSKGNIQLTTTDLETQAQFSQGKVEGEFPKVDNLWINKESKQFLFSLSASLLQNFTNWAIKHGTPTTTGKGVLHFFVDKDRADRHVEIEIDVPGEEKPAIGAIAAMRSLYLDVKVEEEKNSINTLAMAWLAEQRQEKSPQ